MDIDIELFKHISGENNLEMIEKKNMMANCVFTDKASICFLCLIDRRWEFSHS